MLIRGLEYVVGILACGNETRIGTFLLCVCVCARTAWRLGTVLCVLC